MLDSPQLIYVEYANLAKDILSSEFQKDIILDVLKKIDTNDEIFIEKTEKTEFRQTEREWKVICIQCKLPDGEQPQFVFSSMNRTENKKNYEFRISFEVKTPLGGRANWIISVAEKKQIFYIAAVDSIGKNQQILKNSIEVKSCLTTESNCKPKVAYLSSPDAYAKKHFFEKKMVAQGYTAGQEIEEKGLLKEKLVQAGQEVRILFSPSKTITVQARGKSLESAGLDEIIRVEMSSWFSKSGTAKNVRLIEARVIGSGEVVYESR